MRPSAFARYRTATHYALLVQARNRLAFGLLVVFVPIWYLIAQLFTTTGQLAAFKFRATGVFLHVDAGHLVLVTLGLNALTMIVGFMIYSAVRKNTRFDRRLVLCGFPQTLLVLAKVTTIVVVAIGVSLYTTVVLMLFWQHGPPPALPWTWVGFLCAALSYGGIGLLLGVTFRNELAGFFVIIMVSSIDTFIQNPIGNPAANRTLVEYFPSYAPTQIAVAGGFTHVSPWGYVLLSLLWLAGTAVLGLAIFWWRTQARDVHVMPAEPVAFPREHMPA